MVEVIPALNFLTAHVDMLKRSRGESSQSEGAFYRFLGIPIDNMSIDDFTIFTHCCGGVDNRQISINAS